MPLHGPPSEGDSYLGCTLYPLAFPQRVKVLIVIKGPLILPLLRKMPRINPPKDLKDELGSFYPLCFSFFKVVPIFIPMRPSAWTGC